MSTSDFRTLFRLSSPIDRRRRELPSRLSFANAPFFFVFFVAILTSNGCFTPKAKLPEVIGVNPTSTELQTAVAKNSEKIQSIYSSNATVGAANAPGWAKCQLVFERPGNLRLIGTASLAGRVVDCGCNDERFWFWSSLDRRDELYFCKLDRYQGSALNNVLPLDPTWFPEALGVVELKDDEIVDGPVAQPDGSILVTVKKTRPDGVYLKRVYFEPKTAAVLRQDVQNPNGDTIVSVVCKESQYVETPGVVLPKKLEISCPTSNTTLLLDLGTPVLNDPQKISPTAFVQPTDLNATAIDLGASASAGVANANVSNPAVSSSSANSTTSDAAAPLVGTGQPIDASDAAPTTVPASTPPLSNATKPLQIETIRGTGRPIDASVGAFPFAPAGATPSNVANIANTANVATTAGLPAAPSAPVESIYSGANAPIVPTDANIPIVSTNANASITPIDANNPIASTNANNPTFAAPLSNSPSLVPPVVGFEAQAPTFEPAPSETFEAPLNFPLENPTSPDLSLDAPTPYSSSTSAGATRPPVVPAPNALDQTPAR